MSSKPTSRPYLAAILFLSALSALAFVFFNFPPLTSEQKAKLKLPQSIDDVKELGEVISEYKDSHYYTVMLGFSLVYIFLQSFSIPGSIFLSFLSGTLFGLFVGVVLCCFLSATGASGAYMMSYIIGRRILQKFAPDKLAYFGEQIRKHRKNLFNYFLFLRISPLLPNWFVNLASPIFSVPFHIFYIGTFFGVMPQTFLAVRAGRTLHNIKSVSEVLDFRVFVSLALLAFLALIPTLRPVQRVLDRILNRIPSEPPEKKEIDQKLE
jgi:uncharacterized membrane protein YdjX (TVP38/TMEM64 family)